MATDKLINQTQGEDIIDALDDIATNVGNITYGPQTSADKVVSMLGYAEAAEAASINPGDTLNQAMGKLEKKADDNATGIQAILDGTTIDSFGDVETALADKADNDNVYKLALSDADLLPANTDLDNLKTAGCYYVLAAATVPTITHRPTENGSAFRVTVEMAAGTIRPRQIYQEYNSYDKYIRAENSSEVWGGWKKVEGADYAVGVNSSTANNLVAFNDANGKALKDSGIAVATSTTGLADSDTAVPTSKTVKTYVDSTATGISRYLGTITAASQLSTSAKKGDFYVVKTAWSGVHAGDEIIAEKDSPSQTIDGTNWSLLHNEADTDTKYTFATGDTNGTFKVTPSDTGTTQSVSIKGLGNAAYKGVADTVSTSSDLVTSAAVNTKLGDYVPNSDLVEVVDNGAKNIYDPLQAKSAFASSNTNTITIASGTKSVTFTLNGDNTITVSGATEGTTPILILDTGDLSKYSGLKLSGAASASAFLQIEMAGAPYDLYAKDTGTGADITTIPTGNHNFFLRLASNTSFATPITIKPMICTKAQFNISPTYEPYALGNQYLTPELIELCNSGAKNLFDFANAIPTNTSPNVTVTKTSDDITVTSTGSWAYISYAISLKPGTYTFSCVVSDYSGTYANACVRITANANGDSPIATIDTMSNGKKSGNFTITSNGTYYVVYYPNPSGTTYSNTFKASENMICTKAAFGVSQKFVPYDTRSWQYIETFFTSTAADTYEYSGVSFTVPADQVYEFTVGDRGGNANPSGILVADNNTNVVSPTTRTLIAENTQNYTSPSTSLWLRQVSGITIKYERDITYYVWVKRESAATNKILLAYHRIV